MKIYRKFIIPVVMLVLLPHLLSCTTVGTDRKVTFPDTNLEVIIRQAIDKPTGDIYQSDLEGITTLIAEDKDINDVTPLKYCTSLTTLDLHGNQIRDISSLSKLTNLTSLDLGYNEIGDIGHLSNLTNLSDLNLGANEINNLD